MKFKTPELEDEFRILHPEVPPVLWDLDRWSDEEGLPEVVVTHVVRTPEQQAEFYWQDFQRRLGLEEKEARNLASKKFSWHSVRCAVDIRNSHYTHEQLLAVLQHLKPLCRSPMWELLSHDIGRGEHIHIGRQDFAWRKHHGA